MNNKGFAVSGIIYSILILFLILIFGILSILGGRKVILDKLKNDVANELNDEFFGIIYRDRSGANKPELLDNMIPVKYDGTNWVYADIYEEWYDYDSKEWANAVILNSDVSKNVGDIISEDDIALWYVWIPRYKYQLFNANNGSIEPLEIQITFENGTSSTGTVSCVDAVSGSGNSSETCTNATNGNWYTHPAFTFGTQELTGIWVGKFEISTTDSTCNSSPSFTNCDKSDHTITIKPNVSSLRYATLLNLFTAIQGISTTYNLNGDSHMMKNMEWGAVAYLKQSKYGLGATDIGINNNSNFITGCGAAAGSSSISSCDAYNTTNGTLASTTGNIYGVYDMSGGANEYVMGNMVDRSGNFYPSGPGFTSVPDSKYYDRYTYSTSNTVQSRGKLGDATKETLTTFGNPSGGWYRDFAWFPNSSNSWFNRGGSYRNGASAGVFYFAYISGGASSSSNSAHGVLAVRE